VDVGGHRLLFVSSFFVRRGSARLVAGRCCIPGASSNGDGDGDNYGDRDGDEVTPASQPVARRPSTRGRK
jgi:hypothetical protein